MSSSPSQSPFTTHSRSTSSQFASVPRTGLILAAGKGARLSTATGQSRLKPLLVVGGKALIQRVIEAMAAVGCKKVVIVTGFAGKELRAGIEAFGLESTELCFVDNPDFERSNGLSVWAARQHLQSSFILSMADHIVSPAIMQRAASHAPAAGGATLLVDYKIDSVFDLPDATKVLAKDNRIVSIGKQIEKYNCIDTGIFVGTAGLVKAIGEVAEAKGDASLSNGVQALSDAGLMSVLDVGEATWIDVDTPEMLADAEERLRLMARADA